VSGEVRTRLFVWLAVLTLLGLTVAATFAPLGVYRLPASLLIATAKAALIYWVFMDLRSLSGLTRIAALCAFALLAVLLLMTGLDAMLRSPTF
jgi:cytochrome c oxidase subunit 4